MIVMISSMYIVQVYPDNDQTTLIGVHLIPGNPCD